MRGSVKPMLLLTSGTLSARRRRNNAPPSSSWASCPQASEARVNYTERACRSLSGPCLASEVPFGGSSSWLIRSRKSGSFRSDRSSEVMMAASCRRWAARHSKNRETTAATRRRSSSGKSSGRIGQFLLIRPGCRPAIHRRLGNYGLPGDARVARQQRRKLRTGLRDQPQLLERVVPGRGLSLKLSILALKLR
jgi:hypothetical protein